LAADGPPGRPAPLFTHFELRHGPRSFLRLRARRSAARRRHRGFGASATSADEGVRASRRPGRGVARRRVETHAVSCYVACSHATTQSSIGAAGPCAPPCADCGFKERSRC
jgi:hypothetical protein